MTDLHLHSNYSDGRLSVTKLARLIIRSKIKTCALTDHNTTDGIIPFEHALGKTGVKNIAAVEISALWQKQEIHVLVYGFNLRKMSKILAFRRTLVAKQQKLEIRHSIKLFRELGFEASQNLKPAPSKPAGLVVAEDIYYRQANQAKLQKKFKRIISPQEFYYYYQAPGCPAAVKPSGITAEWLVKNCQKIAKEIIIGHPLGKISLSIKPLTESSLLKLIKLGFTGLEIYHPSATLAGLARLKRFAKKYRLSYTGGSDFHGRPTDQLPGFWAANKAVPDFEFKYLAARTAT